MGFLAEPAGARAVARTPDGNMQLPLKITFDLMLTKWSSILNPLLANPSNQKSIIKDVSLSIGENKIPHLLGRPQRGWSLVDVDGGASIYRSRPLESLFLYLTSDAAVTINVEVF